MHKKDFKRLTKKTKVNKKKKTLKNSTKPSRSGRFEGRPAETGWRISKAVFLFQVKNRKGFWSATPQCRLHQQSTFLRLAVDKTQGTPKDSTILFPINNNVFLGFNFYNPKVRIMWRFYFAFRKKKSKPSSRFKRIFRRLVYNWLNHNCYTHVCMYFFLRSLQNVLTEKKMLNLFLIQKQMDAHIHLYRQFVRLTQLDPISQLLDVYQNAYQMENGVLNCQLVKKIGVIQYSRNGAVARTDLKKNHNLIG